MTDLLIIAASLVFGLCCACIALRQCASAYDHAIAELVARLGEKS